MTAIPFSVGTWKEAIRKLIRKGSRKITPDNSASIYEPVPCMLLYNAYTADVPAAMSLKPWVVPVKVKAD